MAKSPLNLRRVRALAGDLWFARGEAYFQEDRVRELIERNGELSAIVSGTRDYRVRLRMDETDLFYSCTCPLGDDEQFCKHCVATVLAWIHTSKDEENLQLSNQEFRENDLRSFLERQEKDGLIAIVLHEAANNRSMRERLQLEAARKQPSGVDIRVFRKSIANATRTGGFVDYYAAPRFARRIHQVIDSISGLFDDGHAKAVVELTEYALARLEKAIGEMDDSDGHMGEILPALHELHHRACKQASEDPKTLAKRLFDWEMKSDWDIFSGTAEMYADVLGSQGLAEYRRLAEAVWADVPALGPGEVSDERFHARFRITSVMEDLARQSGNYEELVAVKCHDLSLPYSFLEIAEIYRQAGKHDQALEWAEKGMRAFPRPDSRLSDFLADEYHRCGRHPEAMDLIWAEFTDRPQLETYRKLQAHAMVSDRLQFVDDDERVAEGGEVTPSAKKASASTPNSKLKMRNSKPNPAARQTKVRRTPQSNFEWSRWRERALTNLRAVIENEKQASLLAERRWPWQSMSNHSRLVEIFLWEKNYEAAWQEASAGGCTEYLWLQLADATVKDHPERAVPIYKELIAPTIGRTNNAAYDEAIKLLRKMRPAMARMGREAEFEDYVVALRVEYKRKRNFIRLLDDVSK
ncbi:MAG TPA: hypothetical protein VK582_12565 [Pyrinomonadaceae bacterium]|nr:hypothetical protein [Pyrinomonadaceae bacterium]